MRSLLTISTVLALACAACGSGGGTLAFDDLEPSIIAAACRINVLCEEQPDEATCVASTRSQDSFFPTMKTDIAAGTVRYDARAARACVDVFGSVASCTLTAIVSAQNSLEN